MSNSSGGACGVDGLLVEAVRNLPGASINIFDRQLRYLFAAGRGLGDVDLDTAMLVGRTLVEVFGEDAVREVRPYYARAFAGESVKFSLTVKERVYLLSAGPLPAFDAIVVIAQDMTEHRRQHTALIETDRRKDQFIITLAHELRQPLAPMMTALELMQRRVSAAVGEQARKVLERQARQLQRLVDALLDVGRIAQGRLELKRQSFDLRTTIQDVLTVVQPEVEAKRLSLEAVLPPDPVWLDGDPTWLQQVFSNLVQNAAKFTEPGGHITVTMTCDQGQIITAVSDTGRGIAPAMLPHVFEMFAQAEEHSGGLGIGLAVVKQIVERHGGSVSVTSAGEGRGADFTVTLPSRS